MKDVRKRIETNKQDPEVRVKGVLVEPGKPSSGRTIDLHPEAPARFEIRLLGQTSQRIIEEVNWMAPDRLETGGHLYSHYANRLASSRVCLVTEPGGGSSHGPHSLRLVPAELPDFLRRGDFVEAGCWHSYPNDNGQPSEADLSAWAGASFIGCERSHYAAIITTPSPGDGSGPVLHGWTMSMDSYGRHFRCHRGFLPRAFGGLARR